MGLRIDPFSFPEPELKDPTEPTSGRQTIVLGGGCFWCTEAVYTQLEGVSAVRPGYAGGTADTADYKTVCTGETDHAEVIEVAYDPAKLGLGQILKLFFSIAHDPTQKDRQGNDVGRQYRSVIFYANDTQRRVAEAYIAQLQKAGVFDAPIVTELSPLTAFYEAEEYHHDYARRNPNQPYIRGVSTPKVAKLEKVHPGLLKADKARR
ncbi:MAG: peptide-methionine (S)-S-oxide reductase MsrA [Polyangiales bacterium]